MPSAATEIYWDSDCFLSYLNAVPERIAVVETLLESSARGEVNLYTSAVSQVEAAFGVEERERQELDPNVERRLDALWADAKVVTVVGYHNRIVRTARRMIRDAVARNWSLKPMDAIQLATAHWLRSRGVAVAEFHTYDRRLFKYADIAGFPILEPHVEQPTLI